MNTLPAKREPVEPLEPTEVEITPTWRDLGDRFRDLMKDIGKDIGAIWAKDGKELERELQVRLLPALKRTKLEIDKLITRLEERIKLP